MSFYQIYFSPTGGTKKVADIVEAAWNCEAQQIDLSASNTHSPAYHFGSEDICLVAVPSFGGRVPDIAIERISKMEGGDATAVMLCVYGNRAFDDTLLELENLLTNRGFRCTAAIAAVAEHSIMHQFGSGRPDAADRETLAAFVNQIKDKLMQGATADPVSVPGNHPYREYGGVPMKPKAEKNCNQCGLCASACPVQAINSADSTLTDTDKCISCMRCVALCPQQARKVNGIMVAVASQKMKKACTSRKANQLFL